MSLVLRFAALISIAVLSACADDGGGRHSCNPAQQPIDVKAADTIQNGSCVAEGSRFSDTYDCALADAHRFNAFIEREKQRRGL